MPHYYPIVLAAGKSLAGDSLGFHAQSLRIDNLTNQWLLEETTLAWIPPYSLGVCLRLYGTGVGIILNQAPVGQPQPSPITGEQTVGVYSDQLRTEVNGTGVRQYTLVQAVSDLTQGPEPAFPPVGVDRLWADTQGLIHHLHSNGQDTILTDPLQNGCVVAGMMAANSISTPALQDGVVNSAKILDKTIQAIDVADGIIGLASSLIQDGAINAAKIQPKTLTNGQIADGTITSGLLAANSATWANSLQVYSSATTTSTSPVSLGFNMPLSLLGNCPCRMEFVAPIYHNTVGAGIYFYARLDGGGWTTISYVNQFANATYTQMVTGRYWWQSGLAAGAHTLDLGWSVTSGQATINGAALMALDFVEFRR